MNSDLVLGAISALGVGNIFLFAQFLITRHDAKEEALKKMTVGEIDRLIEASNNIFGKIFYSQFKKGEKEK